MSKVERGWLALMGGLGIEFNDEEDELFDELLQRGERVAHILNSSIEQFDKELNLILIPTRIASEPQIELVEKTRKDLTYTVTYDWLDGRFLDVDRGGWQLLGYLALIIHAIADDGTAIPSFGTQLT